MLVLSSSLPVDAGSAAPALVTAPNPVLALLLLRAPAGIAIIVSSPSLVPASEPTRLETAATACTCGGGRSTAVLKPRLGRTVLATVALPPTVAGAGRAAAAAASAAYRSRISASGPLWKSPGYCF